MKQSLLVLLFLFVFSSTLMAQSLADAMNYSATGMVAQKLRLTLIAQNMANLTTLEDEDTGLPWQKRFSVLKPTETGVRTVSIEKSTKPFGKYYDPAVPQSNMDGFFSYPNTNLPDEMINLAYTEVVFEANITTFKSTKKLYESYIGIMK